ncbi:unnamed protein product [Urochloa decumbens]|uniref:C2H2-type domain-containing protein n=1 Tax=Urochloa decumbens TaxID=240449 RepID=A0ABC9AUT7_9POAL
MALNEKPPLLPPPSPPPPPPPPPPTPPPPPPPRSIPLHPVQLHDQGEGAIVEAGEKVAALWSSRSESPRSLPHGKLPESGRHHDGGASSSHNMEAPLGPLAGGPQWEEPAVQQGGSSQLRLCEAHNLLQGAAGTDVGAIAGEPPSLTFGQEEKMQEHMKWLHRRRSATPSSSSSSDEAPTPKKARKKPKPEPTTVKMEPRYEEPPHFPFPMVRGATSCHGRSPFHAMNPEVTISKSIATARNVIVIDDDSDDDDKNVMNVADGGGGDGNANPAVAAVMGFGATTHSAPDAVPVTPVARAQSPAAAIEVRVTDDDSSDDDNVVNGNDAAAVLPLPMPRAPVAPIAADTAKGKNAIHEAVAAGHSNASHGKAGAGSSSGGSGKAIAIGGQSKRGSGKTYSCADCDKTFDSPQALGGHANRHSWEKMSMAMPGLQSAASTARGNGLYVFPTGQALGWHRNRGHYAGMAIGSASNASSSSTHGLAAAGVPSETIAMMMNRNANAAATHGPADAVRPRSFPAPAGSDAILALLALSPVAQRMAMAGNPVAGHVSAAATASTGSWSLPAASSSVVPAIPLQNQVVNPAGEIAAAPGNRRGRPIRIFGIDHFPASSSQDQEENLPQAAAVAAPGGNGEQGSIRLFGSDVYPAIPPQNQEGNPPQEPVPGNRGPHTIRLFGVDMAEVPKEPEK